MATTSNAGGGKWGRYKFHSVRDTTLEPWYRKVQDVSGLSLRETAVAAAIATAIVVHDCKPVIDIHVACAIAIHGMVESVKTVPASYDEAEA